MYVYTFTLVTNAMSGHVQKHVSFLAWNEEEARLQLLEAGETPSRWALTNRVMPRQEEGVPYYLGR